VPYRSVLNSLSVESNYCYYYSLPPIYFSVYQLHFFSKSSHHINVCFACLLLPTIARTGRKQVTATKLGIYSTYSPRSPIHFLARCCNFCKPLKKTLRMLSVQPGRRGSNDLRVGRKMANFQLFFQSDGARSGE
jgi:hypothetical protein